MGKAMLRTMSRTELRKRRDLLWQVALPDACGFQVFNRRFPKCESYGGHMRSARSLIARRTMLSAGALAPLALLGYSPAGSQLAGDPRPFVLVHGAWHGGWCWKKLTPLLTGAGRRVSTPTLTGLGERSHLLTPEVDLDMHILDVAAVLEYEDLSNVVLVGHSYGGMVISGVADVAGSRIAHLVYLDAFLPENGKALSDYAPLPPTREDGWRVPPPSGAEGFGVTEEEDIAWVQSRLGDQPLRTLTQPVVSAAAARIPSTFIQCSEAPFFAEAGERARARGFRYYALPSAGHDAMITQPRELAAILLEV